MRDLPLVAWTRMVGRGSRAEGLAAAFLLVAALVIVIGWPLLATILAAWEGDAGPSGGLIDAAMAGGVARPLGLAITTLKLVALAELVALPAGIALALVLARTDALGGRASRAALAMAAFVPMPLHAAAWLGSFGNMGRSQAFGLPPLLVGLPGAAIVHGLAALPWAALLVGIGLRSVEPELEDAALLDLPAWRVAVGLGLRRSLGAIATAALAVAVLTAGDMTVTDLLQIRTYAEEAYVQYGVGNGPGAAATVALPPLLVLGTLIAGGARWLSTADPARRSSGRARTWELGRGRLPIGVAAATLACGLLAVPVAGLAWRAGRVGGVAARGIAPHWSIGGFLGTIRRAWSTIAWPMAESATWGAIAATIIVCLAWSLAWKGRNGGPWAWVAAGAAALSLAVPGPVAGMALVLAYRDVPPIYDTSANLVIAYVLRAWPYALLVLWPAMRSIPRAYLDAAELDGCTPPGVITHVALPMTRAATVAAWGVAFLLSVGELPAANCVYRPGTSIASVVIWGLLHTGVESHLAGVVLVLLGVVGVSGLVVARLISAAYGSRNGSALRGSGWRIP
ncbi:ABC transporter permease subunit [Isosphaeraceae bacterium EP7]